MDNQERDFKGIWIPKEIWLDDRLSALEKVIFVEIDSLDKSERGCWASNEYFAGFCQCSVRTVSAAIKKLTDLGYIFLQSFDGRKRELRSKFTKLPSSVEDFSEQGSKNCEAGLQNLLQNNTYNKTKNNIVNNNNIVRKETAKPSVEQQAASTTHKKYDDIILYLNQKAGTRYRASTPKTQRLLHARLSEGFTLADFRTVIDKKCAEWNGSDMAQYLRPETLFGTKFESYLNAPVRERKTYGANGIEILTPADDELAGIF